MKPKKYFRRDAIKLGGIAGMGLFFLPSIISPSLEERMIVRGIPSTSEKLPVVGLGTWQTFDVGDNDYDKEGLKAVLKTLNKLGGSVIDSSPMYGSSESVVGDLTIGLEFRNDLFYATKVWTPGEDAGIRQMEQSLKRMKREKMDLIQIHNLVDWKTHVKTLKKWKENGKLRYWGITHYVDSSHNELEKIIASERPDFVQFNYSIRSRNAEKSLFDTSNKFKTATIINQPFESGSLFRLVMGKELPDWAKEYMINSWGQYFLKFILSNEQVSCVIPGTSKPGHMIDNALAGYGKLPDMKLRNKMIDYLKSI